MTSTKRTKRRWPRSPARTAFLLRTNSTFVKVALRHRELCKVEQIFRITKAIFETRPVYHSSDAAIRGHLLTSFLALVLRKELPWGEALQ